MTTRVLAITCIALGFMTPAMTDTLRLNNGVSIDGIVSERPDGTLLVQAGDRKFIYRTTEIAAVEKNERTGKFNKEAAMARWVEQDAKLTEETGLSTQQRKQIRSLMAQLQVADDAQRKVVRDKLVALQAEMNVYRYLDNELPQLSHRLTPWVMEAMFYIDAGQIQQVLRRNTQNNYFGTRAKAIELLGRLRDAASADLITRGLADHTPDVRIMAIYALANIGCRESTPALIEFLKSPDMRLANAAREALEAIWKAGLVDPKPATVDEWTSFWNNNAAGLGAPIQLTALQPLILPEEEYQNE